MKLKSSLFKIIVFLWILSACKPGSNQQPGSNQIDSAIAALNNADTSKIPAPSPTDTTANSGQVIENPTQANAEQPVVSIYNFHVTKRCPSCIAIEEATTKTIETYFAAEVKQGKIKRQVLNVDDDANSKIAEKYQAFGSGLFLTRTFKGKETTTDLTGDGFKFAKNKEERFIEILKGKISEYLK